LTGICWLAAAAGLAVFDGGTYPGARALVYGGGVAVLLLHRWRAVPALFLGVLLGAVVHRLPFGPAILMAGLATVEAAAGAWIARRLAGGVNFLGSLEGFGRFVLATGVGLPVIWLAGEYFLIGRGTNPDLAVWVQRWLAYGLSALVLAPVLVLLATHPPTRWNWPKIREFGVVSVATLASAGYAFAGSPEILPLDLMMAYLPVPLVVASALRFSPRETAFLVLMVGAVVLTGMKFNLGLFANLPPGFETLAAEAYVATTGLLGMIAAIVVAQRRRAQEALRQANLALEERVAERTRQLEADNAARRSAEQALQLSEARSREQFTELSQIYRHTPVGLCVLDRQLRFERVNEYLARSNGRPTEAHVGNELAAVAPALAEALTAKLQAVLETGEPVLDFEFSVPAPDNTSEPRRWLASFHPRGANGGEVTGLFLAMTDVTEQRRTEEALRRSEAQRARAEAFARTMVLHIGLDGRFLRVPPAFCELLGYSEAELLNLHFNDVTHPEDRERGLDLLEQLLNGKVRNIEFEKRYVGKDGRVVWVYLDSIMVNGDAGRPLHFITYIRDITQRKAAEAAVEAARSDLELRVMERTAELREANEVLTREIAQRKLAEARHLQALSRLVDLQETERTSVARELHDQLGQELNALNLGINLLRHRLGDPRTLEEEIQRLGDLASRLVQAMHRMAWELRPPALDDFGLDVALQRFSIEWSQRAKVPVKFHSQNMGIERLPLRVETALYRVAQEALSNVYYHARAHAVSLLLQRRDDTMTLIVEDDGQGFDVDALSRDGDIRKRLGLVGMEERILLIGGTLTIESNPGEGTTVLANVPLPIATTPPD
jgi:PAS domain S-box-containing protein